MVRLADSPVSGVLPESQIRPVDEIRVVGDEGNTEKQYTVLAVDENENEATVFEHHSETEQQFTDSELDTVLNREGTYHHAIAERSGYEINDVETLMLYTYVIDNPHLPGNARVPVLYWAVHPETPVETMPTIDGRISALDFASLRDNATNTNTVDLYEAYGDWILDSVEEHLNHAEFNARNIFDFTTEPTYSVETEDELSTEAKPLEDHRTKPSLFERIEATATVAIERLRKIRL